MRWSSAALNGANGGVPGGQVGLGFGQHEALQVAAMVRVQACLKMVCVFKSGQWQTSKATRVVANVLCVRQLVPYAVQYQQLRQAAALQRGFKLHRY